MTLFVTPARGTDQTSSQAKPPAKQAPENLPGIFPHMYVYRRRSLTTNSRAPLSWKTAGNHADGGRESQQFGRLGVGHQRPPKYANHVGWATKPAKVHGTQDKKNTLLIGQQ